MKTICADIGKVFFKGKIFLSFLITFLITSSASAHNVEQFYAEYEVSSNSLTIQFDVAYSIPEIRDDPAAPQPKRSWLVEQSPEQHATLRQEAEIYIRQYLTLYSEGEKIEFDLIFPDFDKSPYSFVKLLNQGAYYRIKLKSRNSITKDLEPHLLQSNSPKLLIAKKSESDTSYITMQPPPEDLQIKQDLPSSDSYSKKVNSEQSSNLLFIGFKHVIPDGLDHILFIIGICLTAATFRQLLWQSLIFTITHALSMAFIISKVFPVYNYSISNYIEPLIALSISLIAIEILCPKTQFESHAPQKAKTSYVRYRYLLIAIFGLIHGCGFAGSLGSSLQSLDADNWISPLIIANIGIELAQALLVIITFTLLIYLRKKYQEFSPVFTKLLAFGIMATGFIWFFQRLP